MDLKNHTDNSTQRDIAHEPEQAFLTVSDARVQRLTQARAPEGASLLLSGDPGCGKSHLAQEAAYAFEFEHGTPVQLVLVQELDELLRLCRIDPAAPSRESSERVLDALAARSPESELLIIAFRIDRYHGEEAALLEHLVRARRARFIGTTQQVVGAADRLARDPGVRLLAVEPLTIDESEAFLSRLLNVDHFAQKPLERWYQATLGNPHALATLALAADRRGAVHRARKVAWVTTRDDHAPADFVAQLDTLTPLEQAALELVAFAAPLHEPTLLHLLDGDAVTALMGRQVLTVRTDADGITAITTRLPIVASAIREHLSPIQRPRLAEQCFEALLADDATLTTASRLRLVRFGMEAGNDLPTDWIWQAMRALGRSGEFHYILRLALAAMPHEDPQRSAEAMLRACDLAHFLNDSDALEEALGSLSTMLQDTERLESVPFEMQFTLAVTSICFAPAYSGKPELALQEFEYWEERWASHGVDARRITQACRMRVLSLNGRLDEAFTAGTHIEGTHDLEAEWLSAPARTFEALLRVQKGEFREALSLAETTRKIILLHEISPTISGDLEGFTIFLAHWARGTTISARRALELIAAPARPDINAVHAHSGLVDLAIILFSLQEARWYDAADLSERLLVTLQKSDPFGILSILHAASALAYAALGERERALGALHRSAQRREPGLSLALKGFMGDLTLQARYWLRDPDLVAHARSLAAWAQEEHLPLIELKALDVIAHETATPDPALLLRAEALAEAIDPPIGGAILAHIRTLAHADNADVDPEERLLSELGIWLPLPPVMQLTGREREIALFTALGYPSKYIAERLHLSARTIETHLAHVYAKLGLEGREELRRWFSNSRETA